jgi:acetyl esterase/lipase
MASAAINQDQVPDIVYPLSKEILPLLDPEFVQYYNRSIGIKLPTHQIDLALIREDPAKYAAAWCKDYTGEPGVTNFSIPSEDGYMIPCRSYTPDPNVFGPGPYPVHINFHGGGFVFGDLTADGKWCMTLRNRVGLFVVDVDYRLMPGTMLIIYVFQFLRLTIEY